MSSPSIINRLATKLYKDKKITKSLLNRFNKLYKNYTLYKSKKEKKNIEKAKNQINKYNKLFSYIKKIGNIKKSFSSLKKIDSLILSNQIQQQKNIIAKNKEAIEITNEKLKQLNKMAKEIKEIKEIKPKKEIEFEEDEDEDNIEVVPIKMKKEQLHDYKLYLHYSLKWFNDKAFETEQIYNRSLFNEYVVSSIENVNFITYMYNREPVGIKLRVERKLRENRDHPEYKRVVIRNQQRIEERDPAYKGVIIQNPIVFINWKEDHLTGYQTIPYEEFKELFDNEEVMFFSKYVLYYIQKFRNTLFKDNSADHMYFQILKAISFMQEPATKRYTLNLELQPMHAINKDSTIKNPVFQGEESSGLDYINIGYRVLMKPKLNKEISNKTIKDLKAFGLQNNRKFHEKCTASVTVDGYCIFETYLDIIGTRKLLHRRRNKKESDELKQLLKNYGSEIEKAVINGELINSLELLTKKDNKDINIIFFNSESVNLNGFSKWSDYPININNGISKELTKFIDIEMIRNSKCFHYDKTDNGHVAPFIFGNIDKSKRVKALKTQYIMKPTYLKNNENKLGGVYGFDFETGNNEKNDAEPLACCVYGEDQNNNIVKLKMYGEQCDDEFLDWLESIRVKKDYEKSRKSKAVPDIFIYGFNNSRFDNLLFLSKFKTRFPKADMCLANRGVKFYKFDNIYIYEIHVKLLI